MPLTPEDRRQLAALAERADTPEDRDALTRLAGDPVPPPADPPPTGQTERVRELLGQIRERTGIR